MSLRPPAEPPAVGRPPVGRRLLVVGRDPGGTAVIAVGLRPRFETETGTTGAEALAHFAREPLSLIIADLAQGDLDAAFSIRALAARSPDCQIIVIGSIEHAGIVDRLAGLHVYGFFTRPVDFGALVARVSSLSADEDSAENGALALSRSSAKVLEFLSAHYADSFNLQTLARDVRVEVAKQLLVHEDHKLDRVAEMTGFVDGSHLSRVFRLYTGRSPGQYRIELRSPRPEDAQGVYVQRGCGPRRIDLSPVPLRGQSGAQCAMKRAASAGARSGHRAAPSN